ncbi:hypothetical protein ANANG_G00004040 [Anguilla anguilla]|uniref:NIPA-like protein 3 n=1 Tax=Anguilla anguilla TaxID=7936 RepID=A0A9D3MWN2_ANGAN|nr:hypothetical protein ANANG_G00004040 [Anguilla anguilla]
MAGVEYSKVDSRFQVSSYESSSYTENLIGTLLAIFGNLLVSISLSIQKYSHVNLAGNKDPGLTTGPRPGGWRCVCHSEFHFRIYLPAREMETEGVSKAVLSVLHRLRSDRCWDALHLSDFTPLSDLGPTPVCLPHRSWTFIENIIRHVIGWPFLLYLVLGIIAFCLLLYFYRQRNANCLIVVLMLVALLGSVTVVTVKAISGMILLSILGNPQLTYPIFYVMFVSMVATVVFQATFLSQASHRYDSSLIASVNYILSTTFAIIAGAIFYLEFNHEDVLHICMFLLGCAVCFLGVFLITKNRKKGKVFEPYVTMDVMQGIPTIHDKGRAVQPEYNGSFSYGSLGNNDSITPATLPVAQEQLAASPSSNSTPYQSADLKRD